MNHDKGFCIAVGKHLKASRIEIGIPNGIVIRASNGMGKISFLRCPMGVSSFFLIEKNQVRFHWNIEST